MHVFSNPYYSVETLPESPATALVRVSGTGHVITSNASGKALWGWKSGDSLPVSTLNQLLNLEPVVSTFDRTGQRVSTTCLAQQDGWLLIGQMDNAGPVYPEKSSIKTLIENTPAFHHSFASHTPQGILFLDSAGKVLYANQKLKELMHREDGNLGLADSYKHLGFDEGLSQKISQLLEEKVTSIQHSFVVPEEATGYELGVYGTPIFDTANKILGAILNFEVRHSPSGGEETGEEGSHSMQHMTHLKNVFVAMMSHELRTPLGVMNGYSEILCQELDEHEALTGQALPPQIKEFVLSIHENAQRVLGLVNELFDLSNMRQLTLTPMNLDDALLPVMESAKAELEQKGVRFVQNTSKQPLRVFSNPNRLSQILFNLLSNAVKFTHDGSVTVTTRKEEAFIVIEITDTGVGISQDYLDELFTPFVQEDMSINRRFEGAGLGLALVKLLIDLMKGRIEVESEKGTGSTFRIYLPAA